MPGTLLEHSWITIWKTSGCVDMGDSNGHHNPVVSPQLCFFLEELWEKGSISETSKDQTDCVRQETATFHVGAFWRVFGSLLHRCSPCSHQEDVQVMHALITLLSLEIIDEWVLTSFRYHFSLFFLWIRKSLQTLFLIIFQFVLQISMSMNTD